MDPADGGWSNRPPSLRRDSGLDSGVRGCNVLRAQLLKRDRAELGLEPPVDVRTVGPGCRRAKGPLAGQPRIQVLADALLVVDDLPPGRASLDLASRGFRFLLG